MLDIMNIVFEIQLLIGFLTLAWLFGSWFYRFTSKAAVWGFRIMKKTANSFISPNPSSAVIKIEQQVSQ